MKFEVVAKYGHTSQTFYILLIHNIYIYITMLYITLHGTSITRLLRN